MTQIIVLWAILTVINVLIARSKNQPIQFWLAVSVLMAPLAFLVLVFLPSRPAAVAAATGGGNPFEPVGLADSGEGAIVSPWGEGATVDAGADLKMCPDCCEPVKSHARVCRYCGYRFAPPPKS